MLFLLSEILNYQGSTHLFGVGSFSILYHEALGGICRERKWLCVLIAEPVFYQAGAKEEAGEHALENIFLRHNGKTNHYSIRKFSAGSPGMA